MRRMSFRKSNKSFEAWLGQHCAVVQDDLRKKHKLMKTDAFVFLRATYFRWAQIIETVCPALCEAPAVLAVGDTHVENFGTWRDLEGRLIWGVNDFDEAAVMPYAFDLVRLATSARLAFPAVSGRKIAAALVTGYRQGLKRPAPFVLDEHWGWLLRHFDCDADDRHAFWRDTDKEKDATPPPIAKQTPLAALPEGASPCRFVSRHAGCGSRGRPRYAVVADLHAGRIVREAKALVPSAWDWAHGRTNGQSQFLKLARNPGRASDPYLRQGGNFVIRRLAPDSRKLEFGKNDKPKLTARLLTAMGREIAGLHSLTHCAVDKIGGDLGGRPEEWLHCAAKTAAKAVADDFKAWRNA